MEPLLALGDAIALFTDRPQHCYHCGTAGREARPRNSSSFLDHVFALPDATVLVVSCPACDAADSAEALLDLHRGLERDVRFGLVPGVRRVPSRRCPVPGCSSVTWARTRTPSPLGEIDDPRSGDTVHPCPWCVEERLREAAAAHHGCAELVGDDFAMWRAEFLL